MKPSPPSRTVRGWCLIDSDGFPFISTVDRTRKGAIESWASDSAAWKFLRDRGFQAVRCSITTEVEE